MSVGRLDSASRRRPTRRDARRLPFSTRAYAIGGWRAKSRRSRVRCVSICVRACVRACVRLSCEVRACVVSSRAQVGSSARASRSVTSIGVLSRSPSPQAPTHHSIRFCAHGGLAVYKATLFTLDYDLCRAASSVRLGRLGSLERACAKQRTRLCSPGIRAAAPIGGHADASRRNSGRRLLPEQF